MTIDSVLLKDGGATLTSALTGTTATLTTADNLPQLTLISTDTDASVGPLLDLYRNSASPADNDIVGRIRMQGENSAGETINYVTLFSQIQDVTDGTEDGRFFISAMTGGTDYSRMDLLSTETVFNQDSQSINFRVETSTVSHALFLDAANDRMGIFESSPSYTFDVDAETRFQKQINYGGYTSEYPADVVTVTRGSSANDTAWVKIGTLDNPGQAEILYSCGTSASEETGTIFLMQTYSGANLGLTVKRQTYNQQVLKVRAVQVGGGGTDYEIWVQIDNGSDQTSDPYVRAIVKLAQTLSISGRWTYAMSVGTPGTAVTEVDLAISEGGSAYGTRNQTAYSGFTNNSLGAIFNNDGADSDFRVESVNNTHTLFVDSSADKVMVGTSVGPKTFSVLGSFENAGFYRNFTGAGTAANFVGIGRTDSAGTLVDGVRITGGGDENAEASHNGYFNLEIRNSGNFRSLLAAFSSGNELVVNDGGLDLDFRVESDGNTHMLFVDAGNNRLGIGSSSPNKTVEILAANATLRLEDTASGSKRLDIGVLDTAVAFIDAPQSAQTLKMSVSGTESFTQYHNTNGSVFNEGGADRDFRVESDGNANMLFVDGGNNVVVIGGTTAETADTFEIISSDTNTNVRIRNTNAGDAGPRLIFDKASASAANDDNLGELLFIGKDSSGNAEQYARLLAESSNITAGAEDGTVSLEMMVNGTNTQIYNHSHVGTVFNEEGKASQDFRVESDGNANMLFVDASANTIFIGGTTTGQNVIHLDAGRIMLDKASDWNIESGGSASGSHIRFRQSSADVGSITSTSSGTTYNTTSDRRLKKDIETITDGTDKLMAMNPVTHGWKAEPEADAVHGFIAQEMRDIVPEAVSGDPDGEEMMSMDYGRITPIIVAALQDATNEIKALKERVKELEASQ